MHGNLARGRQATEPKVWIAALEAQVMDDPKVKVDFKPSEEWEVLPEHSLLRATIERAAYDLQSKDMTLRREARVWVLAPSYAPWTFLWMCEHLRLSEAIRKRLRQLAIASNLDVH